MKLILTEHSDHVEIELMDGCQRLNCYTVENMKQAEAFCTGFHCAKSAANNLVQSLPLGYEKRKFPAEPETIGQQLSRQWVGRA